MLKRVLVVAALLMPMGALAEPGDVPDVSFDVTLHAGYGQISWFREQFPWHIGMGLRGLVGKHIGDHHRIGGGLGWTIEGPVPSMFSTALEPQASWDAVYGQFTMGVSVGVSGFMHYYLGLRDVELAFSAAPMASFRVGYSNGWPGLHRSLMVVLEPRVRWMRGEPSFFFVVSVGSRASLGG